MRYDVYKRTAAGVRIFGVITAYDRDAALRLAVCRWGAGEYLADDAQD